MTDWLNFANKKEKKIYMCVVKLSLFQNSTKKQSSALLTLHLQSVNTKYGSVNKTQLWEFFFKSELTCNGSSRQSFSRWQSSKTISQLEDGEANHNNTNNNLCADALGV